MNTLKTWVLMGILSILIVLLGSYFGGRSGAVIALIVAIAINGFSYFFSDQIALSMSGAKEVTEHQAPDLYTTVRHLATRAGLPMPRLYVSPSPVPNAFATGRDPKHSAIVVNEGLITSLDKRELAGVLAHEMSHIRHRDILIASMAATLAGAITWLAQMLQWGMMFGGDNRDERNSNWIAEIALMILAPIAATLVQLAISRSREYKADAGAAQLTRDPDALADALAKLDHVSRFGTGRNRQEPSSANTAALAHLYIVNPLKGQSLAGLFSTHPPTEERIRRLRLMRIENTNRNEFSQ